MTIRELQDIVGIQFKDQNILRQAFVHRSYLNEHREITFSNERMEFLGDAILSFLTSKYLYATYPDFPEGILTNIRSSLVKTTSLGSIASELGFGELLLLSKGEEESGGRKNTSLLADTFEAFLGAVFLDRGIQAVEKFLRTYLFPKAESVIKNKSYVDFKSLLQEIIQEKSRVSPTYRVVKTEGPDHNKTFWVEAITAKHVIGKGMGKSKQEAEQKAAQSALAALGKL